MKPVIRVAASADVAEMLAIYAPYVRDTSITFETEVPAYSVFENRLTDYLEKAPWLVAVADGRIAGYAYASMYRERVAYQWSVECSVYIGEGFQRRGIGRALYAALFEILRRQGFRNVYAVINLPNEQSVALHEAAGFTWFATYEQVGYKLGHWKNVGWWRLVLNPFTQEPAPPVFFRNLEKDFLPALFLEKAELIK